jgi:hypothetical protein
MHDLLGIIDRRKPDAVAILGDLTEEKDRHSAKLVNQIVGELGDIAAVMPLLMLMGNHDYRNEGHPFFAFTRHIPNVAWVDKVSTSIELPEEFRAIFDGCLFLPHTLDYERDWAGVDFQDFRFIFAHNTFAGAISNGRALDGVPAGIFPDNARVLSGDIHTPQKIGPVTYIGAPYTIDFGDDYDPRLMMVQDRSVKPISVKAWPQKRLVTVDDLEELGKYDTLNPGDIVKVRITQDDIGNWGSVHRSIKAWAEEAEVELFRAEPILQKATRRNVRIRAGSDAISDETMLRQYAKRHDIDDETLKIGLEFIKK